MPITDNDIKQLELAAIELQVVAEKAKEPMRTAQRAAEDANAAVALKRAEKKLQDLKD